MFFILFADTFLGKAKPIRFDWLKGSLLLFGLVIILSIIGSEFKIKAFLPLTLYLKAITLFFYILNYCDPYEVGDLFWVLILSGLAPAFYGIFTDWEAVRGLSEKRPYFIRAISTYSGPVEFGYQMALRVIVLLALPWKLKAIWSNVLRISLIFVFLLSVAISFTRNSYIAIILGLVIILSLMSWDLIKKGEKGKFMQLFGFTLLVGFFFWLIIPHRIIARLGMLRLGGIDPSLFARPQLWGAAWKMFLDHPISGVGFGVYSTIFADRYVPHAFPLYAKYGFVSAHNLIFMTLSELGLLGIFALVILMVSYGKPIVRFISKVQDPWRGYLIACLTLGITSFAFSLFDFVWIQERTATLSGFLFALAALSIYASHGRVAFMRLNSNN